MAMCKKRMSSKILVVSNTKLPQAGTLTSVLRRIGRPFQCISRSEFIGLSDKQIERPTIILGGVQSATDPLDTETKQLLRVLDRQSRKRVPLFGICLGAQLLARIAGGRVYSHQEGIREIGYHPVYSTDSRQGSNFPPGHYYQWHYSIIDGLPADNVTLTNNNAPIQAFEFGRTFMGVQFHPEIERHTIQRWARQGWDRLGDPGAQPLADQLLDHKKYGQQNVNAFRKVLVAWSKPLYVQGSLD